MARNSIPDAFCWTCCCPKLGGREAMQALKHDLPTAQIPILVFSSLPQTNEERRRDEGAAGYFDKSRLVEGAAAEEKELIRLIETIVQKSRKSNALQTSFSEPVAD